MLAVKNEVAEHDGTEDGTCAGKGAIESAGGAVEPRGVDGALVGIEKGRREEHGTEGCGKSERCRARARKYKPSIRQSTNRRRIPKTSSLTVALAWSLTREPSARMTRFGPRTRNEEPVPINIITRNAWNNSRSDMPGCIY
jgi:hypothetical protein